MNRKLTRITLLIAMFTFSSFIGGLLVFNKSIIPIQMNSNVESDLYHEITCEVISQDYTKRGLAEIDDACCGHVDTTSASISIHEPPFQSIVLAGGIIEVVVIDDNPMYSMTEILYHWDTDLSNTSFAGEDPAEDDLKYQMVVTAEAGVHTMYVYGVDYSGNWASESFSYTVVLTMDPPVAEFIFPSTSNDSLTGIQVFQANVTDDLGLVEVKIQIDSGATFSMEYNETTGYYSCTYNVSMLTNGPHLLKVTAVDVDHQQHTITESIDFTVFGGQDVALVSDAPEWEISRSDFPENISKYIDAGNFSEYIAETGNIYFKFAAKDDVGIATVDLTVYALKDFDPNTDDPDISDARTELAESLSISGTDGDWNIYEYTWNSNASLDGYYLCVFEIQDTDEVANHLTVGILLKVDNIKGDETTSLGRRSPGFEIGIILLSFPILILIFKMFKRKKDSLT